MDNNMVKGVPEAKDAMSKFKYEVASEIGVPLKQGYNGDLTSAQNGYVGGYMVNTICPEQHNEICPKQHILIYPKTQQEFRRLHANVNNTLVYTYSVFFAGI